MISSASSLLSASKRITLLQNSSRNSQVGVGLPGAHLILLSISTWNSPALPCVYGVNIIQLLRQICKTYPSFPFEKNEAASPLPKVPMLFEAVEFQFESCVRSVCKPVAVLCQQVVASTYFGGFSQDSSQVQDFEARRVECDAEQWQRKIPRRAAAAAAATTQQFEGLLRGPSAKNDLVLFGLAFSNETGAVTSVHVFDDCLKVLMNDLGAEVLDVCDCLDNTILVDVCRLGQKEIPFLSLEGFFIIFEQVGDTHDDRPSEVFSDDSDLIDF